ncbi:bifunctional (p)ppGpp synthetase/guanosine-3',5'-bis(diphosphate) 3'-pyrophosphohydrolase [Clostridium perfringens]|uniref:GTP diphosphokinase n=1 Tax=Clostridium perfringens D str. JGS1721 TaxID=488537 RepID=B1V035_CLOPF|nr:bifunctional (p)ppGpp synthetase/guanosine-3',5'-bis(diphosphate) 3'-pyrophosphohydrolase [Clostridium perfringens]WEV15364.1 bifunctional (p)ppGpp synthetase/guanosine-3',5'-bis(diphosphate) 3'-pyrophosphohydrolase [Clostridium perfringens D]EDT72788.1 GTP pyrophosphokinase [Clostridium perfringens D str. JGS1721]EHK2333896.1 bifunctional (p)ppGpp synthetase/guanosine-3',5'-bis(diphosphate) 3'-pyrophosphohydrolase [Clostridium perfringens]EJT6152260.1 bifunctional (p)ppGpp synthetase/guanos
MLEELISKIKANGNNVDIDLVKKAYDLAFEAHKEQKRESGEPYIIHPISVAMILADMGMDTNTIVAGLLHDVIEDTDYTYEDISNIFNVEVANLVDGVTKLGKIKYKSKEEQQADNVRKMLLAMAKDIRVIIIKLADRLHNMRTLKYMKPEKQKKKAQETLDIFAPLAHRLGISKIKWELEDLCLRYIHPEEYYDLVNMIAEKRVEREKFISRIIEELKENLDKANIDSDIEGRPKHFYSIYRKMVNKHKSIEQIFDLTAIRILVNTVKDCYAVLGIVHTIYKPIPGRFKDYIAMPKPNMYQSLHTTVIGSEGKTFEIQIRTFEMHRTAEYGIAAHWKYKSGVTGTDSKDMTFENKLTWLRDILEWQKEAVDATEFMEGFKLDLFSDEIFVFTPKGVVINLPAGATPIDFAYKIHTDIGNKCVGAKVNGKIVTLDYKLKTGEIVEILTSSSSRGPNIDWLNIANSNQARSKIKQWLRKARREENLERGKEMLEKECKKQSLVFSDLCKGPLYDKLLKRYHLNNVEEIYVAVGEGELLSSTVISKLKENVVKQVSEEELNKNIEEQIAKTERQTKKKQSYGVTVKGLNNIMVRFARCCNPVPGDDIAGYITKGRGVSVHRKDCSNFKAIVEKQREKVVDVSWGTEKGTAYVAELEVKAEDRMCLLSDVMLVITDSNLSLLSLNAKSGKNGVANINIQVKIDNIEQLKELMKKIRRLQGILDVYRVNK